MNSPDLDEILELKHQKERTEILHEELKDFEHELSQWFAWFILNEEEFSQAEVARIVKKLEQIILQLKTGDR